MFKRENITTGTNYRNIQSKFTGIPRDNREIFLEEIITDGLIIQAPSTRKNEKSRLKHFHFFGRNKQVCIAPLRPHTLAPFQVWGIQWEPVVQTCVQL